MRHFQKKGIIMKYIIATLLSVHLPPVLSQSAITVMFDSVKIMAACQQFMYTGLQSSH